MLRQANFIFNFWPPISELSIRLTHPYLSLFLFLSLFTAYLYVVHAANNISINKCTRNLNALNFSFLDIVCNCEEMKLFCLENWNCHIQWMNKNQIICSIEREKIVYILCTLIVFFWVLTTHVNYSPNCHKFCVTSPLLQGHIKASVFTHLTYADIDVVRCSPTSLRRCWYNIHESCLQF